MAIGLSGLASGIDTETIVSQLMAIERRPQDKLKQSERRIEVRQNALRDIITRLNNLKTAAADLRSAATWAQVQTADSSDAPRLSVRRLSTAGAGAYQVEVSQLARAEQRTFNYATQASATTLDIKGVTVSLAADATVDDAVGAINTTAGITVQATNVGGQVVLTAKQTGTGAAFTALGPSMAEDAPKARTARDALYTVDGVAKVSQGNLVTDAISGLELSLKGLNVAGTPTTVTVGALAVDKEAVKAKVKAFVDQYNSTTDLIRAKTTEKKVKDPTTEADRAKGVLFGDRTLTGILSALRIGAMSPVDGLPNTAFDELAEIGVTTGATTGSAAFSATSVTGKLVFDEAKLTAALDANPDAVKQMLGALSPTNGIAQRFEGVVDLATASGGSVDAKITNGASELTRLRSRFDELDRRLALREDSLRARFRAMERALAASQAQSGWLSAQMQGS